VNAAIQEVNASGPPDRCTVVVIYEDGATRARALSACDYLVSQIWENVELDFHWWRTDFLKDPHMAEAAARHAIVSDFLIVCSREGGEISTTLEAWFGSWIGKHQDREGALIDLTVDQDASVPARHRQNVLREIASRGRFDYLTAVPEQPGMEALRSAEPPQNTAPIGDLYDPASRPPSHFGLND
jgi:hypothetical protein